MDLERIARQLDRLREDAPDNDSDARLSDCFAVMWSEAHRLAPDCVPKEPQR